MKEEAPRLGAVMGRVTFNLDPKKRFTIPSTWRERMGSPAYVYVLADPQVRCLNILPPAEMDERLERLRKRALFEKGLSEVLRILGESSEQLTLDVQGRIRVSDRLLRFAMLVDRVTMVGGLNRIQVWSPALLPDEGEIDQVRLANAYEQAAF